MRSSSFVRKQALGIPLTTVGLLASVAAGYSAVYLVPDWTVAFFGCTVFVLATLAFRADRSWTQGMPVLARPAVLPTFALIAASVYAFQLPNAQFDEYVTLWTAQVLGFTLGILFPTFGRAAAESSGGTTTDSPPVVGREQIERNSRRLFWASIVAAGVFFAWMGVPVLGADVEQGRVDAAVSGTGYLRLIAYMCIPAFLILFALGKSKKYEFALVILVVLALANRSPLLYLMMPMAIHAAVTGMGGLRRVSNFRVIAAGLVLVSAVVAFGVYRIISQSAFADYSEYRESVASGNYLSVAEISFQHYAGVIPQNAVLTKDLSDSGALPKKLGASYVTLFTSAIPGEQLSLDREIKLLSGSTFVGGGTPPTLMGEAYVNFGLIGSLLIPFAIMLSLRSFARTRLNVGRPTSGKLLPAVVYGYAITWIAAAQVAGLAGASTFPLAGFLALVFLVRSGRVARSRQLA